MGWEIHHRTSDGPFASLLLLEAVLSGVSLVGNAMCEGERLRESRERDAGLRAALCNLNLARLLPCTSLSAT